ncbi:adenosylhomocysteinase [Conexibacter sp. DBS9H8]|uniref:adenosylhomocysteinase n=1 Tax=Conexibacter sp. DBS9H8 TaxID=2937801 RepID=UPI0020100F9F|nr:adenosylhomocysteinase [Conexibacter sp. DBS9H8]
MRAGADRIAWAASQMPVLASVAARLRDERPLAGVRVAACLHLTAETAVLVRALLGAGAEVAVCSANPLSAQDDVSDELTSAQITVRGRHGDDFSAYERGVRELAGTAPDVVLDDGGDLLLGARPRLGGTEETTTGLLALRRAFSASDGALAFPVLAVNEARTERALNDRHGTGQSALDGIVRASNVLLAGQCVVILGYGSAGMGVAERARGAGAAVIVCEVDPLRALEARMAGYEVMPALAAAARGDIFITVTGSRRVLSAPHFAAMKSGVLLANAGHFDVEIDLDALTSAATGPPTSVRPLVDAYALADGRVLNLIARGRVVNLAAAEGHPAAVMDVSFALQALAVEALVRTPDRFGSGVVPVPAEIDAEVARLKLAAVGVAIDTLTVEQEHYRRSWA